MQKDLPEVWGFVDSGTVIRDVEGHEYVVDNQHGWVVRSSLAQEEPLKFEALDNIDRHKFQIGGVAQKRQRH